MKKLFRWEFLLVAAIVAFYVFNYQLNKKK